MWDGVLDGARRATRLPDRPRMFPDSIFCGQIVSPTGQLREIGYRGATPCTSLPGKYLAARHGAGIKTGSSPSSLRYALLRRNFLSIRQLMDGVRMRIVTGLIFLPAQHLVARMHLDLNARDRIRFNQFFDCRPYVLATENPISQRDSKPQSTTRERRHTSPDKNPPTVAIFLAAKAAGEAFMRELEKHQKGDAAPKSSWPPDCSPVAVIAKY